MRTLLAVRLRSQRALIHMLAGLRAPHAETACSRGCEKIRRSASEEDRKTVAVSSAPPKILRVPPSSCGAQPRPLRSLAIAARFRDQSFTERAIVCCWVFSQSLARAAQLQQANLAHARGSATHVGGRPREAAAGRGAAPHKTRPHPGNRSLIHATRNAEQKLHLTCSARAFLKHHCSVKSGDNNTYDISALIEKRTSARTGFKLRGDL
jgi:hypothetical protein